MERALAAEWAKNLAADFDFLNEKCLSAASNGISQPQQMYCKDKCEAAQMEVFHIKSTEITAKEK